MLDFDDLEPRSQEFTLFGKKYLVREATGGAAIQYRNGVLKSTRLGPEGKPKQIDGAYDADLGLVSSCTYTANGDGKQMGNVPVGAVKAWPSRAVDRIVDWIKENSDLDASPDDPDKLEKEIVKLQRKLRKLRSKDPDPTTVGSSSPESSDGTSASSLDGEDRPPTGST